MKDRDRYYLDFRYYSFRTVLCVLSSIYLGWPSFCFRLPSFPGFRISRSTGIFTLGILVSFMFRHQSVPLHKRLAFVYYGWTSWDPVGTVCWQYKVRLWRRSMSCLRYPNRPGTVEPSVNIDTWYPTLVGSRWYSEEKSWPRTSPAVVVTTDNTGRQENRVTRCKCV